MTKFIIYNYTNLSDIEFLAKIDSVIRCGKISKTKSQGEQYSFITEMRDDYVITCEKRNNTYTFKIFKELTRDEKAEEIIIKPVNGRNNNVGTIL